MLGDNRTGPRRRSPRPGRGATAPTQIVPAERQAVEGVELDLVTMPGWPLKLEKTPIRTASPSITNELIRLRRAASVRSQSWPFCVPRRTRFSVALNYQAISVVFYREASPA
jgi:hypothetical protein